MLHEKLHNVSSERGFVELSDVKMHPFHRAKKDFLSLQYLFFKLK